MKVEYISNRGNDTVANLIAERAKTCIESYFLVGFVTNAGLEEIMTSLRNASNKGSVKFLTGFYLGVTEPNALRGLLKLKNSRSENFEAFIYTKNNQFHKKIYVFKETKRWYAIIGSSNVTDIGLKNEGEGNVYIIGDPAKPADCRFFEDILKDFDQENCKVLSAAAIKAYEGQRSSKKLNRRVNSNIDTRKIFKLKAVRRSQRQQKNHRKTESKKPRYFIDLISGTAEPTTEKVIRDVTNWDTKGFNWYAIWFRPELNHGDIIYIMDEENNRFYRVRYKDYCKTKFRTPDGIHFVAYVEMKGYKLLNRSFLSELRQIGITKKWSSSFRQLKGRKLDGLKAIFK